MCENIILRVIALSLSAAVIVASADLAAAGDTTQAVPKTEHFDRDPGWDALNNRMKPDPKDVPIVVQDFGYSATNFAGGEKGEVGGQVWRCTAPAFYADRIPVKTLNERLTASGKFAFTSAADGSGIWFGWFRGEQQARLKVSERIAAWHV